MPNNFMADLNALSGMSSITAKKSTSRKNNTSLDMQDFLQLMIVQFQNQTIDNTADTGEILNQMVQMQSIQAITNVTDAVVMQYAGSLVGKEVTIGQLDGQGKLQEIVVTITGTGYSNGEQVIFAGDDTYKLSDIMAVGRLPKIEEEEKPGEGEDDKEEDDIVHKPVVPPTSDGEDTDQTKTETTPAVVPAAPKDEGADLGNSDLPAEDTGNQVNPATPTEG